MCERDLKLASIAPGDRHNLEPGNGFSEHLMVVTRVLYLPGVTCSQMDLERGMRCLAEVLLQTAPRLLVSARAAVHVKHTPQGQTALHKLRRLTTCQFKRWLWQLLASIVTKFRQGCTLG